MIRECGAKGKPIPALPSPELVALHAVCAWVAHKSEAAEYFAKLKQDAEETTVLESDVSSACLLHGLLSFTRVHVGKRLH